MIKEWMAQFKETGLILSNPSEGVKKLDHEQRKLKPGRVGLLENFRAEPSTVSFTIRKAITTSSYR